MNVGPWECKLILSGQMVLDNLELSQMVSDIIGHSWRHLDTLRYPNILLDTLRYSWKLLDSLGYSRILTLGYSQMGTLRI